MNLNKLYDIAEKENIKIYDWYIKERKITMETNEEIDKILECTPFNSYEDLINAVFNGRAQLNISRTACIQISQTKKPIFSNFGLFLGSIPSIIITIWYSIASGNLLFLLTILLEFILPYIVYFFLAFNIKIHYISYLVVISSIIFELPNIIVMLSLILLFTAWGIISWEKSLYRQTVQILQFRKDLFVWAFSTSNLSITDCYGNTYNIFNLNYTQENTNESK